MSLASRQLGHIEQRQNSVTLELYQYTIRLLISQDPNKADATVLATCALLCVYEMMASGVSEWRRHLKGCAGLFRVNGWKGSSRGIVKWCFWAFARNGKLPLLLPAGKTTLVPTDFWMDDMSIVSAAADGDTENYCNLAILVFAKIVNLLATFSLSNRMSESEPRASMTVLWNEFQEWYQLRPKQVYPLLRSDCTPSNTLPNVAFTQSSPVCGNTFYHAGCILLLQAGLLTVQACSSQVNSRSACSVEEFAAEKILLLKHLALIGRETGWKTSDRAADLRDHGLRI
ncbi:hypothetical protein AFGD_011620 [Aspergillus flavus]|nr:hypothetical protein AFGD_011620 [Aspergillus flavus]